MYEYLSFLRYTDLATPRLIKEKEKLGFLAAKLLIRIRQVSTDSQAILLHVTRTQVGGTASGKRVVRLIPKESLRLKSRIG